MPHKHSPETGATRADLQTKDTSMISAGWMSWWLPGAAPASFGAVLLTGTGIVPPGATLQAGDKITITIDQVGELVNEVKVV
jgi:hypothetical protein